MKKLLYSAFIFLGAAAFAQTGNPPSKVAMELFRNVKTTLSAAEKNQVATALGFILSGNKDEPFAQDKDSREYPFGAMVYPVDLNKDGREEVFVSFGNSFTSGMTGSSIVLFIKPASGAYAANLGFPGTVPDVLSTASMGYPDLLIGGPGFEFPVWRWNGKEYVFSKKVKDAAYDKLKKESLEELSKNYQAKIK
jgi:hypothetical protein